MKLLKMTKPVNTAVYGLLVAYDAPLAEKEGFEPPEVLPSTVFKTAAIDHSAISPVVRCRGGPFFLADANIESFFISGKVFLEFLGGKVRRPKAEDRRITFYNWIPEL